MPSDAECGGARDCGSYSSARGDEMYLRPLSFVEYKSTWLRNARLNFRQLEETHLMENVMYNELCLPGYSVDVGVGQEERPLVNVGDGFRKVIITRDNVMRHNDENGILIMSFEEFLMDEGALER